MKGKYAEEYWSLKKSGHQSLKSDEMSFGHLETKHKEQIGSLRADVSYFLLGDLCTQANKLAVEFKFGQSHGPVSVIF